MNSWLAQIQSRLSTEFADWPTSDGDESGFSALQKAVSSPLPTAFRDFLLWRPLGVTINFHWELTNSTGGLLLETEEMLRVIDNWKKPGPPGTTGWGSPHWVPILSSTALPKLSVDPNTENKDYLCLDTQGTFGHPAGSLLQFMEKNPARAAYFPSVEGWLQWIAQALEQGMGRFFFEDQRLEIVLNKKAVKLHQDLFPKYPVKGAPEVLGLSLLDQVLNVLPRHGLKLAPGCSLPKGLSFEAMIHSFLKFPVRQDGIDEDCVRVIFSHDDGPKALINYINLKPTPDGVIIRGLATVPENAGLSISNAMALIDQGEKPGASKRLSEAAYLCFQAGFQQESQLLLRRALELDPANQVARRSMATLEAKRIQPKGDILRPLIKHIGL